MEIIAKSAQATQKLGEKIGVALRTSGNQPKADRPLGEATIITLTGELGSGKTTFVQGFAKGLGLPHRVLSPTFILMRRYALQSLHFDWLYHIDLYRLEKNTEIDSLGLGEIFRDPRSIVLIEWPERLGILLPDIRTDITFEVIDELVRKINVANDQFLISN